MIASFWISGRSNPSACTTGGSRPTSLPFPKARADVPAEYVGLTNRQLWDRFGKALGGEVAPAAIYTLPYISGGLIAQGN